MADNFPVDDLDSAALRREIARLFYDREIVFDQSSAAYNAHDVPDWPNDADAALVLCRDIAREHDWVLIIDSSTYSETDTQVLFVVQWYDDWARGLMIDPKIEYAAPDYKPRAMLLSRLALIALRKVKEQK